MSLTNTVLPVCLPSRASHNDGPAVPSAAKIDLESRSRDRPANVLGLSAQLIQPSNIARASSSDFVLATGITTW